MICTKRSFSLLRLLASKDLGLTFGGSSQAAPIWKLFAVLSSRLSCSLPLAPLLCSSRWIGQSELLTNSRPRTDLSSRAKRVNRRWSDHGNPFFEDIQFWTPKRSMPTQKGSWVCWAMLGRVSGRQPKKQCSRETNPGSQVLSLSPHLGRQKTRRQRRERQGPARRPT